MQSTSKKDTWRGRLYLRADGSHFVMRLSVETKIA